jgi:hypothetical protein
MTMQEKLKKKSIIEYTQIVPREKLQGLPGGGDM